MNAKYRSLRRLLPLRFTLAVILLSPPLAAVAANPAYVGITPGASNSSNTRTPSCACATDDLIITLLTSGGTPASPTVSDTQGTVITDFAFSGSIGIYRVHNAADVSHSISVSWGTAPSHYYLTIVEASGIGGVDSSAGTPAINSGSSVNPTTGSLTPNSGDLLLAETTSNLFQSSGYTTWTNDFTGGASDKSGPSWAVAYLNSAPAGSISTQTTIATSTSWNALLVAYEGATTGFLAAGHWVAAQLPMMVIFPRPDSETNSYARPHWAFWDGQHPVKDVIPIIVQGGAYPYVFTLLSGPPGASIAQNYWVPGTTPTQMYAAGYGDFTWTPQGNISSPWTGTVSVLVTGQDLSSITVSFTLSTAGAYATSSFAGTVTTSGNTSINISVTSGSVAYGTMLSAASAGVPTGDYIVGQTSGPAGGSGTYTMARPATESVSGATASGSLKAGFLFIDATCTSCDTTGSGSISSPWQTLNKVYGSIPRLGNPTGAATYPGAILYLRGNSLGVDYEAYDQTGGTGSSNAGIMLSGGNNPMAVVGFPGDPLPDIDITNLHVAISNKGDVFDTFDDGSDLFLQNMEWSGTPSAPAANFSYEWEGYDNSRMTYDNILIPDAWPGTNTLSSNSTGIELDDIAGGSVISRNYVVIRGITELNRPTGYQGQGIFCAFTSSYGVAEFDTFEGSTTPGVGYAFGRKTSIYRWTDRYDYSSGGALWLNWQGGYQHAGTPTNTNIEDAYDIVVYTGNNPANPGFIYNQAVAANTGYTFNYRNSVIGTGEGVAQSSTTGNGPFWFSSDAIQYGTGLTQGITFSTTGHVPYVGGTFPSNVIDATLPAMNAACQGPTGIFNGSYQLTGACESSYLGQVGAQIQ